MREVQSGSFLRLFATRSTQLCGQFVEVCSHVARSEATKKCPSLKIRSNKPHASSTRLLMWLTFSSQSKKRIWLWIHRWRVTRKFWRFSRSKRYSAIRIWQRAQMNLRISTDRLMKTKTALRRSSTIPCTIWLREICRVSTVCCWRVSTPRTGWSSKTLASSLKRLKPTNSRKF